MVGTDFKTEKLTLLDRRSPASISRAIDQRVARFNDSHQLASGERGKIKF
jgi:hypothetical protein